MAYAKPYPGGWKDLPDRSTPIDAAALGAMDTGIDAATKTADAAVKTIDGNAPDGAGNVALSSTYVLTANVELNVKLYGAKGDGATDDTTAIANAVADAKSKLATYGQVAVRFPRGKYLSKRFTVPGGVHLVGEGRGSTVLHNTSTDGLVFVLMQGSFSTISGLTLDGQHAAQTTEGTATVQFARPNGTDGNAGSAGLAANVAAGATSLTVSTASPGGAPILAGEYLSLVSGSVFELARVAPSYTGGTAIPLANPLANAFTTTATVTVASTDVGVYDCHILGNGRDGIAFWHTVNAKAVGNIVEDFEDTGIDVPSAGSWWAEIASNRIETKGRWGVAFDTAETAFGPVSECTSHDNVIRFLSGGSYPSGNTIDGIYFGNVNRCKSLNDTVDLTLAGVAGATFAGNNGYGSTGDCEVVNLTVTGPATQRAGTTGVRVTASSVDNRPTVRGGLITNMANGVDLGTVRAAVVNGVHVIKASSYGVTTTGDTANAQKISVSNVYADGNVAGVRFGAASAPAAGNSAAVVACVLRNSSFATVTADTGWNVVQTSNVS